MLKFSIEVKGAHMGTLKSLELFVAPMRATENIIRNALVFLVYEGNFLRIGD